jgi:cyclin-dependent kinase-like
VDTWSIGCILAEMITGMPLFPGESDIDTLHHIMRMCGERLPRKQVHAFAKNPMYDGFDLPQVDLYTIDERISNIPSDAFDLLKQCLAYEPENRPQCDVLLMHRFFDDIREDIEQFLADVVSYEAQERSKLFKRRDATPNKMTFKSVLLDPEQMIPK